MAEEKKTGKRDEGRNLPMGGVSPGLLHIITYLPAFLPFLTSCADEIPVPVFDTEIALTKAEGTALGTLDLFFYNDDNLKRLDSYQHFSPGHSSAVSAASGSGKKIVKAVANRPGRSYPWTEVCSVPAIEEMSVTLDEDDPQLPVMSGTGAIDAGSGRRCTLTLTPMLSEISLESISCDFSERSYSGETLKDVRIYLTNVCSSAAVFKTRISVAPEFLNLGGLDSLGLAKLRHPEYIFSRLTQDLGEKAVNPALKFYCYENVPDEESAGSPCTKLVIEGTLGGNRVYYPLAISEAEGNPCVLGNRKYRVNVTLTRRGGSDPDSALESGSAEVTVAVKPWTEKEEQYVSF